MVSRKDILTAIVEGLLQGGDKLVEGNVIAGVIAAFAKFSAELAKAAKGESGESAELLKPPTDNEIAAMIEQSGLQANIAAKNTDHITKMIRSAYQLIEADLHDQNILLNAINDDTYETRQQQEKIAEKLNEAHPLIIEGIKKLSDEHGEMMAILEEISAALIDGRITIFPTTPSRIHKIPQLSLNHLFKGRENDLNKLIEQLNAQNSATAITQAIAGLGGIGKTRLAIEYGWRCYKEKIHDYVFFVNCSQETTLDQDKKGVTVKQQQSLDESAQSQLLTALSELGSPEFLNIQFYDPTDPITTAGHVLQCLRQLSNPLIVFDNVDHSSMAQAVNDQLSLLDNAKIIITTRLQNFPGCVNKIELEKISTEAAAEYLLEKTCGQRISDKNDPQIAGKLAEALDGLPVALEQAAAYINYQHISFEKYLEKFRVMEEKLLGFNDSIAGLDKDFKPVLTVWTMTEELLSPMARAVLTLAAFLAPDKIPASLFINQADGTLDAVSILGWEFDSDKIKDIPQHEKEELIEDAIAELVSFSMISRNASEPTFNIHRLVQKVIRLRLSREHLGIFTQLILEMTGDDQPDYEEAIKTVYQWHRSMESHLQGLITFVQQLWPEISDIPEPIVGNLTTQMNNLAQLYKATNRLSEAEPLMERALEIDEQSFGKDHPNVATACNNLAGLYLATNRLSEAEPLMERALEIDEQSFGKDHPEVATDCNNLAQLYQATNRLSEAEPLMERVITIFEKSLGKDHPNVATACNNLAQLYMATNRLSEAEPLMLRALEIDEQSFGKDHPDVARDCNNLAQLYQATNRLSEAEPLMERVITIFEKSLGKDHPNVATACNNLAQLYQATNRLSEAEPLIERVITIFEKSLGKDHPNVATACNNLAQLYQAMNRLSEAEPLMERHLIIFLDFTRKTGHPHPHLQGAFRNYRSLHLEMGHSESKIKTKLHQLAPEFFPEP